MQDGEQTLPLEAVHLTALDMRSATSQPKDVKGRGWVHRPLQETAEDFKCKSKRSKGAVTLQ